MNDKFILKSKTIIGGLLLVLRGVGVDIPFTDEELTPAMEGLWTVVGFALIVWGRLSAKKPLGWNL